MVFPVRVSLKGCKQEKKKYKMGDWTYDTQQQPSDVVVTLPTLNQASEGKLQLLCEYVCKGGKLRNVVENDLHVFVRHRRACR
jgi:hypothetical protein